MSTSNTLWVIKKTTYLSALTNSFLAILKILVGVIGHSNALVADGLHSLSDLITDALVLVASKAGHKSPDQEHPYGHQRIETIAAAIIALTFLSAGLWVAYNAIIHLLQQQPLQPISELTLVVAAISAISNELLFRYTLKKGQSISSNLLITNAWHSRSDVYVSLIVLISIFCAWLGLHYFDAIGATLIALLIIKIGIKMAWDSFNELIDAGVDPSTLDLLHQHIKEMPGVTAVHQLRTRTHSGNIFVDVHIEVNPKISVSEGHFISEQVRLHLLHQNNRVSDVTVHIDPENDEIYASCTHLPPRILLQKELTKRWQTLPGFNRLVDIKLHYLNKTLDIELIFPLDLINSVTADHLEKMYSQAIKELPEINKLSFYFVRVGSI